LRDATLHSVLREGHTVRKRAEELQSIASEYGMSFHRNQSAFLRGWALADEGRWEEGVAEMLRTMPAIESAGPITGSYALLAESFEKNARHEEGLALLAKGLREAEQSGERFLLARLHGIKGELILMSNPSDEAEAERSFRTAIDIARRQSARFYELRATVSLARLLKRQGKTGEARAMLSEIYNWFTEGFETADLRDAKALLQELGE